MPEYTRKLIERSRELRRNMTEQERRLWYCLLRDCPLKFYRQRPIGGYIADFYCRKLKLVIEIDGEQHNTDEAVEYDSVRTEYMKSIGLRVLRFSNQEIDCHFDGVCSEINNLINKEEKIKWHLQN